MVMTLTPTTATTNLVRVSVGPLTIGLDMQRILGIERADRIRPFPERPELVGRIVNRAGEWPVLNLADRLDLKHTPDTRTGQVILIQLGGANYGLFVDRVYPVQRLTTATQKPMPRTAGGQATLFHGVVMVETGPVLLLNPDRLNGDWAPEPEPAARPFSIRSKRIATDRMLVLGQFEYPLPGGRMVGFGVPVGCVVEITDVPPGTTVPGSEPHVVEMTNWREGPLTVINLATWCGVRSPAITSRRVVVMGTPTGERVGVLAGTAVKILTATQPHLPLRREISYQRKRVLAAFEFNDVTVLIPDLSKLK